MVTSMVKRKRKRSDHTINGSCKRCEERCQIRKVCRCWNGTKKGIKSRKKMMGNQMKVVREYKKRNAEQHISIQQR